MKKIKTKQFDKTLILFFIVIIVVGVYFTISKRKTSISQQFFLKYSESKNEIILPPLPEPQKTSWEIQSIDTMKQSRDLARSKLHNKAFDKIIDKQVSDIAQVGATHIAIATPYDKEFTPFLRRWVKSARKNNINIWYRGNWSGWEGWFDYPKNLSKENHIKKTANFILENSELFKDGDIFSPCPECENGNIGDPRQTKRVKEFRKFIIDEHKATQKAFAQINKNVKIFYPFNGDVAKLIMNKQTTDALGGYVTIDHYVKTPEQTVLDIQKIAKESGGKIILGEFGVPILDIHGKMTEEEQSIWIDKLTQKLSQVKQLVGINYWVNMGGSTAIWNKDETPKKSVSTLREAFSPYVVYGRIIDEFGQPIEDVKITSKDAETVSDKNGFFAIKFISYKLNNEVNIYAKGFLEDKIITQNKITQKNIKLIKKDKDWKYNLRLWVNRDYKLRVDSLN